ncbi:hypothetical protein P0082_08590 [Candidatus Haliotispira prima]|uniref:Uncharacterized protein n=1 Tax=Candidatus Haliotispira prima TaxID=3034016 RepID=A0ABY8MEX2_9SPIO|nr:hypothetical protein P0082_08590 [Candidatus Haliotispira prima]
MKKTKIRPRFYVGIIAVYFLVRIVNQHILDYDRSDLKSLATQLEAENEYRHEQFVLDFVAGAKDYLTWNITDIPLINGKKDIFITILQVCENYFRLNYRVSSSLSYEWIAKAVLLEAEAKANDFKGTSAIDIYAVIHRHYDKNERLYAKYFNKKRGTILNIRPKINVRKWYR